MGDGKFSTVENNLGEYMLRSIEVDNQVKSDGEDQEPSTQLIQNNIPQEQELIDDTFNV